MSYKVSFKLYSNGVSILFTYKLIYLNLENIKRFNSDLLFFHVKPLLCTTYHLFSRCMCVLHLLGRHVCIAPYICRVYKQVLPTISIRTKFNYKIGYTLKLQLYSIK